MNEKEKEIAAAVRLMTVRGGRITPVRMAAFNVAAYGETCTAKVKAGVCYEHMLITSNLPPDALQRIVLTRGGADDYSVSANDLVMLESYKKRPSAGVAIDGLYYYVLPFAEIMARAFEGMGKGMYVTMPGENITLNIQTREKAEEANFGGGWPVTPSLKLSGYTTPAKPGRIWMPELKTISTQNLAVGEVDFHELPQDVMIKRLFLKGDISEFELKQNSKSVIERISVAEYHFNLKRDNPDLVIPAGYLVIDFISLGFANADVFDPASNSDQDLKLTLKVGTAGNIPILVDGVKRVA